MNDINDAPLDFERASLDNNGNLPPPAVSTLARQIIEALNKHHPKWSGSWNVTIDTRGGIVQIINTALSGRMGFVLKITSIDPEMRAIRDAAGELFERYGIARDRAMGIRAAIEGAQRDIKGNLTHDD